MNRHALVILHAGRAHRRALTVRADRTETRDGSVVFIRGERTVHLLHQDHVREIRWFDDARSAELELAAVLSAKAGAATFDVQESVAVVPGRRAAPRQGGAGVAESVTTSLQTGTRHRE